MKLNEAEIFCEMWLLSLIYSYVAVCMLCAVRCVIIICFCRFLITRLMVYNIFRLLFVLYFCFYFVYVVILCFFNIFYSFLCSAVSFLLYKCTDCCHQVETQLQ